MIKNIENKKMTARQKSKELLEDALNDLLNYWQEKTLSSSEIMTDSEKRAVTAQLQKLINRALK